MNMHFIFMYTVYRSELTYSLKYLLVKNWDSILTSNKCIHFYYYNIIIKYFYIAIFIVAFYVISGNSFFYH